jgi:thiamine pyrophosphokinase
VIVHSEATITLVGGATLDRNVLQRALDLAPRAVAADSGADTLLGHGVTPEAVIGDFDSMTEATRKALPPDSLHRIAEQDSTDFDKCLRNIDAPLVIGVGFTGDRQDHQLACMNTLVRYPDRPCILLGRDEVVFLCPPALRLNLRKGTRVSLFPLGAVEGVSDGLRWPINGLNLAPDGMIGTSNEALGPVEITVTSPKMLVILPSETLTKVITAMIEGASNWR